MHPIAQILDQALSKLDPTIALRLERTVQEAVADAVADADRKSKRPTDAMGYPIGCFEATSGSFANEPFDLPEDLPPENRESW